MDIFPLAKVLLYWQICNFFAKNMLFLLKNLHNSKKGSTFAADFAWNAVM